MSQTTYLTSPLAGRNGMVADLSLSNIDSYLAENAITYGLIVQQGTEEHQAKAVAELPAVDPDAITLTPLASAVTDQDFVLADFDGDDEGGPYIPARTITFLLNAHADWDPTQMRVVYIAADGTIQEAILDIPDGGDVELKTSIPAGGLRSIHLPAQTGTNGTLTVGLDNTVVELQKEYFPGVAVYAPGVEPSVAAVGDVDATDALGVLTKGRLWVTVEADVEKGDPCYVRMVESGSDLRGQARGSAAVGFARYPGAVFHSAASADAVAQLELS